MKLERYHYEAAYELTKGVRAMAISIVDARAILIELEVDPKTATTLLINISHLTRGSRYKKPMSTEATDYFITWIQRDGGRQAHERGVSALVKHIDYLITNTPAAGDISELKELLMEHESKLLREPKVADSGQETEAPILGNRSNQRPLLNVFENDPNSRSACVAHHGTSCVVCNFSFVNTYGPIGEKYIQIHHLQETRNARNSSDLDPIEDLRPVCPNCHAMLHSSQPALTIGELKALLHQNS